MRKYFKDTKDAKLADAKATSRRRVNAPPAPDEAAPTTAGIPAAPPPRPADGATAGASGCPPRS